LNFRLAASIFVIAKTCHPWRCILAVFNALQSFATLDNEGPFRRGGTTCELELCASFSLTNMHMHGAIKLFSRRSILHFCRWKVPQSKLHHQELWPPVCVNSRNEFHSLLLACLYMLKLQASSRNCDSIGSFVAAFYDVLRLPMTSYDIPTRLVAVIGKVTQARSEPGVS
jgi:hypothetical protein